MSMMVTNGYVIQPSPELLPDIKICPFSTDDIGRNRSLPDSDDFDQYLKERFFGRNFQYTNTGRQAIAVALALLNLQPDDVVTILTTSGNFYISRCVTEEIEKRCRWSRTFEPRTRVIFINHEFGYPFTDVDLLKDRNYPVIEDFAHSFFSCSDDNQKQIRSDYAIYSFPKMFPLQIGGLLISDTPIIPHEEFSCKPDTFRYINNVLSHYIHDKDEIISRRKQNHHYLADCFSDWGFKPRFEESPGSVPGVFLFTSKAKRTDWPEMKSWFYMHGIQCSVFYGEDGFFLPVHQNLGRAALDYMVGVMKTFLQQPSYEIREHPVGK